MKLKFRGFWLDTKKPLNVDDYSCDIFNDDQIAVHIATGLKDVKNNEIYYGDIIYWFNEDEEDFNYFFVDYKNGKFVMNGTDEEIQQGQGDTLSDAQIVGNIIQNPELLEKCLLQDKN